MNTMKQLMTATLTIVLALCISCSQNEEKKVDKACLGSYEFVGNGQDTVNVTDCHGYKQGKWVPSLGNKLKDTLYYRNDTIIH